MQVMTRSEVEAIVSAHSSHHGFSGPNESATVDKVMDLQAKTAAAGSLTVAGILALIQQMAAIFFATNPSVLAIITMITTFISKWFPATTPVTPVTPTTP